MVFGVEDHVHPAHPSTLRQDVVTVVVHRDLTQIEPAAHPQIFCVPPLFHLQSSMADPDIVRLPHTSRIIIPPQFPSQAGVVTSELHQAAQQ